LHSVMKRGGGANRVHCREFRKEEKSSSKPIDSDKERKREKRPMRGRGTETVK